MTSKTQSLKMLPIYVVKKPGPITAVLDAEMLCLEDRNRKMFPEMKGDGWFVRLAPNEVEKFQAQGCTVELFDPNKFDHSDVIISLV